MIGLQLLNAVVDCTGLRVTQLIPPQQLPPSPLRLLPADLPALAAVLTTAARTHLPTLAPFTAVPFFVVPYGCYRTIYRSLIVVALVDCRRACPYYPYLCRTTLLTLPCLPAQCAAVVVAGVRSHPNTLPTACLPRRRPIAPPRAAPCAATVLTLTGWVGVPHTYPGPC